MGCDVFPVCALLFKTVCSTAYALSVSVLRWYKISSSEGNFFYIFWWWDLHWTAVRVLIYFYIILKILPVLRTFLFANICWFFMRNCMYLLFSSIYQRPLIIDFFFFFGLGMLFLSNLGFLYRRLALIGLGDYYFWLLCYSIIKAEVLLWREVLLWASVSYICRNVNINRVLRRDHLKIKFS